MTTLPPTLVGVLHGDAPEVPESDPAGEPVSAVDLDAIEEWARGSTIVAARARIPALVRELRESREELASLRADIAERDQLAAEMRAHVEASVDAAMNAPPCARCGGSGEERVDPSAKQEKQETKS